jgi:hypothetical protein
MWSVHMRHNLNLGAAIAMSLMVVTSAALAQTSGGTVVQSGAPSANSGSAGISSAPGGPSTTTTGIGTAGSTAPNPGLYQPGTARPGTLGAGTSRSLPDDDPVHTGFPSGIGR